MRIKFNRWYSLCKFMFRFEKVYWEHRITGKYGRLFKGFDLDLGKTRIEFILKEKRYSEKEWKAFKESPETIPHQLTEREYYNWLFEMETRKGQPIGKDSYKYKEIK